MIIHLKKANVSDISTLLMLEKSVAGTMIYSPMLKESEWVEEFKKGVIYLIEKDNIVVGSVAYEKKDEDHVYISGLVIHPQSQGQGIAHKALQKLLEELNNIKRIDLVTHPENERALKLYQSFGFKIESRKENYFGDGEPRLVLVLTK